MTGWLEKSLLLVYGSDLMPDGFGESKKHASPRTVLWRADADAGAVANLVLLVQDVDEIDARCQRAPLSQVENVVHAEHSPACSRANGRR